MTRPLALSFAFALFLAPSLARADVLPLEESLRLGPADRPVALRVEPGEPPTLTALAGAQRDRAPLPLPAVTEASVERVAIAAGHHVAVVRAAGDGAQAAAFVAVVNGRPQVVWTGRTDLHGDPGERRADVISLEDRTGDGFANVVVGIQREGASLCGESGTLLAPRAFDPARGAMRPVILRRVPEGGEEVAVEATRESPGPSGPPLLSALRFTGASSAAGHDPRSIPPPRALGDGDPATFWAEGRGGPGAGEYAVARFDAGFPIRAFAVTAATGAGTALGRPRGFWLVGDQGPRVRVTMPQDAGLHPGERYWIPLPAPVRWRCVALVLDEAYAPAGVADAAVHTGLGELEAYTELDFGGGVEQLVAILVEGREGGDEAARLLAGLGGEAVVALAAAWPRLDEVGRRRAVRVFAEGARRDAEGAVEALAVAAQDDTESVREPALEALGALGPEAGAALAHLVREPPPLGDAAIAPLLRHPPTTAIPALLAALSAEGGSERPLVREALARSLSAADEEARRAFEAWRLADPPVAELASAALGLASQAATRPDASALLSAAAPRATAFADRYRLVRAAAQLEQEPDVDAWLSSLAGEEDAWMLRAAALEALDGRSSERRTEAANRALDDAYPRVRVAAIEVLDRAGAEEPLTRLAEGDAWPMVREAAIRALWDQGSAREVVRGAVRDRSARVREAALQALTRAEDRAAWPLVRARLADSREWPQVTVAALRYVAALCIEDASEVVAGVIRRGLVPSPWPPDVDVAGLAVDVGLRIGGPAAEEAARLEARPDAPASMRAAAQRRREDPARCAP